MGRKVEGGIRENQNLVRFEAAALGAPVKDQLDLMARNWFSLVPGRTEPIEHSYNDARSNREETIVVSCTQAHGIATIHDQDLLLFVISQWIEARRNGIEYSRRVSFKPYQFFQWIGRTPNGGAYQRLKDALERLSGTRIETTKNFDKGTARRNVKRQFTWVSEWEIVEENGSIRGVEVVLAEWLYESVQDFHVLTLDRSYFDIRGSMERWLYIFARKAAGNSHGLWKEKFKSLYRKSASQQAYKHFRAALMGIIERNELPGVKLTRGTSRSGDDMLIMEMQRAKNTALPAAVPEQLVLIEKTPHEQDWENLLEVMKRRIGEATCNSWVGKLEFRSFEGGTLTLAAPTKFVAGYVTDHFAHHVKSVWATFGHEVDRVTLMSPQPTAKAG